LTEFLSLAIPTHLVEALLQLRADWPRLRKLAGRSLEHQRDALVRVLRQYGDQMRCRMTVVFDGYAAKRKPAGSPPVPGVEVLFSEHGKTADDVIERLVGLAAQPGLITVISSDNLERSTVEGLGAHSLAAEVFEAEVDAALRQLEQDLRHHSRHRRLGSLREHFE
jgi:predicted RNA-binding protein with PIN domain